MVGTRGGSIPPPTHMWYTKYADKDAKRFACERDYIDFAFIMIVLREWMILLMPDDLLDTEYAR